MSVSATAQLLSNTLYHKRFFPFYTFNLCAGLDDEGGRQDRAARAAASSPACLQQRPALRGPGSRAPPGSWPLPSAGGWTPRLAASAGRPLLMLLLLCPWPPA
jgi:hypothetical protein